MESGRSTVRPNVGAQQLAERLAKCDLKTAIVITPEGVVIRTFHRVDVDRRLAELPD